MSEIISKKLLSLVLDKELMDNQKLAINKNVLIYATKEMCIEELNLDTLSRLCEDFCEGLGFDIRPRLNQEGKVIVDIFEIKTQRFLTGILYQKNRLRSKIKATEVVAKKKGLLS